MSKKPFSHFTQGALQAVISEHSNGISKISPIALAAKDLCQGEFRSTQNTPTSTPALNSGLQNARRALASFVDSGMVNGTAVGVIYDGEGFLPIEGLLIDYKREIPSDRFGLAKFLRHVLAFHNTFGGFIVVGADEVQKDTRIIPVLHDPSSIDTKKLRDLCREYFSAPIELQSLATEVSWKGALYPISVIHIPKRTSKEPVLVRKDGPRDPAGALAFGRDEVYLREGDNTVRGSTAQHWRLLYGERQNPYALAEEEALQQVPIWNDLPDRGFICQDFIGRNDLLSHLFSWLADDFTCVRVLAGEGGLGKTSTAYQFATEVSRSRLANVEGVVWLTAKRQQFRAMLNYYEEVANRHFSSSRELFAALASSLGDIRKDWTDVSESEFPRILRDLARHIKIFFVIDDLDSLELNEQKRAIEVCQQLSGLGSRFLFTTRKNATASTSTSIEVMGLDDNDYPKLIESWQARLTLKPLSPKEVGRLRETTGGSPLYTESLLRLVKAGIPVGEAIAKWRGNLGIEVRNAALKREVIQLENEAKKVLVAAAVLGECSLVEIKQATGYSDPTLIDATNELQSLFLLHAPAIADQPRFSISNTTRELVLALGPELISEFNSFQDSIKQKRYKAKGQRADVKVVGIAINQATALLAAQQPAEALRTVDEVNSQFGHKNSDLLSIRGRVLLRFSPPRREEARRAFRGAYSSGQRKPLFFNLWYENEIAMNNYESAVDIASSAFDASVGEQPEWLMRRASSRLHLAVQQDKRNDTELSKSQLSLAADDLSAAMTKDASLQWDAVWKESLFKTHDSLWTVITRSAERVPDWVDAFDSQLSAAKRGDVRVEIYRRLQVSLSQLAFLISGRSGDLSEKDRNLIAQRVRLCIEAVSAAPKELGLYKEFREVKRVVNGLASEFSFGY